jgi:hypothetical protein
LFYIPEASLLKSNNNLKEYGADTTLKKQDIKQMAAMKMIENRDRYETVRDTLPIAGIRIEESGEKLR